jgi:hypothetical protein
MKVLRRVLAALGLGAFVYALSLFQFWYRTPAGPRMASINGVWHVENCGAPTPEQWPACVQSTCESEANNRQLLPRAERIIVSYMHARTNKPEASVVAVRYEIGQDVKIVQCTLEQLTVVNAKSITQREFNEL